MMCRGLSLVVAAVIAAVAAGCANREGEMDAAEHREPFVRPLPETHEYARLLEKTDAVSMRAGLMTLEPGKDCGWHSTDEYEELIICLAGAGEVETEGRGRRPLAAGSYAYNPPQLRHCVFNTGTQAMRYVYVVAPAVGSPSVPRE
jgi:quercetin dioxygenase-like cupin family protein